MKFVSINLVKNSASFCILLLLINLQTAKTFYYGERIFPLNLHWYQLPPQGQVTLNSKFCWDYLPCATGSQKVLLVCPSAVADKPSDTALEHTQPTRVNGSQRLVQPADFDSKDDDFHHYYFILKEYTPTGKSIPHKVVALEYDYSDAAFKAILDQRRSRKATPLDLVGSHRFETNISQSTKFNWRRMQVDDGSTQYVVTLEG